MTDDEDNKPNDCTKKLSFKHEWNNFSIYCWQLMERSLRKLDDDEKNEFKKQISSARTSLEKVKVIINNVKIMDYLKNHNSYQNQKNQIDNKKDNKFALNCKKIGDVYYGKKNYEKALKFYSRSILFFDKDNDDNFDNESTNSNKSLDESISLSTIYINRARTLIKLEKLDSAYADYREALNLEPEINNTKDIKEIDLDGLASYYKPNNVDFNLREKNEKLEGASAAVRMDYCEDKGRMIYSERAIEEGEILFMERPYVHWLRPTYYQLYCHQCLKRLEKHIFIPCDKCTDIRYCSTDCRDIGWKRYHETECKYLKLLKKWPSGHMGLRLMLRDGIDYVMEEDLKPNLPLSKWPEIGFEADYSSIRSLTGEDNFTDCDYYTPLIIGCVLIGLLFELNNEIKEADLTQFSSILIKSIMQILENTFMIYDYDIKTINDNEFLEYENNSNELKLKQAKFHQMSSTSYRIGVGLYSSTSLIPHSCDNNSNKYYFGSSILIVAARPIELNDEVNIEYGVHYKINSLKYRKEYLKNNFGFDCKCNACLNSYENVGLSFKCLKCQTGALIRNQDNTNYCLNCDAKDIDLSPIDLAIKKAEEHFHNGIEAYKNSNLKKSELEFRAGEKLCSKIYFNDIKLQFIKCELSHLYLVKKNYQLAYQYLFETLPVNKNLYGDNSIEVLVNHIELACLALECIDNLSNMGFSVKQTSQRLFRQLMIKMLNKNKDKSNLDDKSTDEIDKKLSYLDELTKWKIIFKRHLVTIEQLYNLIAKREAKIVSDDGVNLLKKLPFLKNYLKSISN